MGSPRQPKGDPTCAWQPDVKKSAEGSIFRDVMQATATPVQQIFNAQPEQFDGEPNMSGCNHRAGIARSSQGARGRPQGASRSARADSGEPRGLEACARS